MEDIMTGKCYLCGFRGPAYSMRANISGNTYSYVECPNSAEEWHRELEGLYKKKFTLEELRGRKENRADDDAHPRSYREELLKEVGELQQQIETLDGQMSAIKATHPPPEYTVTLRELMSF
jgi:hypothetical protein